MKKIQCLYKTAIMALGIIVVGFGCESSHKISIGEQTGLVKHQVMSDSHPLTVWEKSPTNAKGIILFVHGRTWSSLPDFDLQVEGEDLSLMDGMVQKGYGSYAVDLRGYGETPRDESGWNTPSKASKDIVVVVKWLAQKTNKKVHLFGWSMGSTLSLLAAQDCQENLASLTLFGFWQDMDEVFSPDEEDLRLKKEVNTAKAAASDFITPGSISQKAVETYVRMSLKADPVRADWRGMEEYNASDPGKIEIPVLIIQGEFDPVGPSDIQAKLFARLKTADKTWSVISGGDHAAHLEKSRYHFIKVLNGFIDRFN